MAGATGAVTAACPACGEAAPGDGRYCEACGADMQAAPRPPAAPPAVCPGCGASPEAVDGYCAHCGMKQPDPHDHVELDLDGLGAVTDRGLQHHRNEDAVAAALEGTGAERTRVVVVCDGVSSTADSHLAARAASAAACERLRTVAPQDNDEASLRTALVEAVAAAQAAVVPIPAHGAETPSCTIVASLAVPHGADEVLVATAWLGDSRAYVLAGDAVVQITVDDSWATEQIAAGTPVAEAFADPRSHSITRWLGADAPDVEPHVDLRIVGRGERLLLCSDGLWNYAATPAELATLVVGVDATPLALARTLTDFALHQGGHDNITVAVVRFDR